MKLHQFEEGDLDSLMEFLDDNLTENYRKEVFLNIKKKWPDGFLLIKDQQKIIGVGCGAILPNEKLRILIIALEKEYQGRGLGTKLMDQMISAAMIFGITKVTLEVRKDSQAINFYRKLGFSSVDVLPCYYQDGCDGIVMERQLKSIKK
jgi:ribosomal-protein-alanine N-acetyltransferase|tara:strand:- start:281 stop:727 length:447 start_codon:yes stop_codon:yes gene_type:complete